MGAGLSTAERRQTFSVFVRRGNKRLMLRRYVPDLERARAFVDALRRDRFHDPEAVIIVDDLTRATVSEQASLGAPDAGRARRHLPHGPARLLQARETSDAPRVAERPAEPRPGVGSRSRAAGRPSEHIVRALSDAMASQTVFSHARARFEAALEGAAGVPAEVVALRHAARRLQEQNLTAIHALRRTVRALTGVAEPIALAP
jgi:hypothetical protein